MQIIILIVSILVLLLQAYATKDKDKFSIGDRYIFIFFISCLIVSFILIFFTPVG